MEENPAPAAADVEEARPVAEVELGADVTKLPLLRGVDVFLGVPEIRARVDHLLAQPQLEEVVAQVVVHGDVAPRLLQRVHPPPAQQSQLELFTQVERERLGTAHVHQPQKPLEVALHRDGARHVRFAEAHVQIPHQAAADRFILQVKDKLLRAGPVPHGLAVPESHGEGRSGDLGQDALDETLGVHRVLPAAATGRSRPSRTAASTASMGT